MGKEVLKIMQCMKCGKPVALGQAFCKDCLEDMSHYPVSPSTPVQIPVQPQVQSVKRNPRTKKAKKPEEQILHMRKIIRRQALVITLLLLMLTGLGVYTVVKLQPTVQPFRPGENYISSEVSQQLQPTIP